MAAQMLVLARFLPYRLSVTSNRVSQIIASEYQALYNLSIPQWRIIAVIAESGPVVQQTICQTTHMDKVTVSRAAIGLVDREILYRMPNSQDRRSHHLNLTAMGHELYRNLAPRVLKKEIQIFSSLSEIEREQLMKILARIESVIDSLDV